ncbi:unnamed protein product [Protopolystoma xenopodis]|uniref:Uncharacterized protein n=1 Tax=Protopolystoma xenopodis TaxID=117903 RepID=A0A448WZJ8_9PLAT|nr:unnamed protein product [Protopolystoma xenopodis]
MQQQILSSVATAYDSRSIPNDKSSSPSIILCPPIGPDIPFQFVSGRLLNPVGIAFPLRSLPSIQLLCLHLAQERMSNRLQGTNLPNTFMRKKRSSINGLPSHWILGELQFMSIQLRCPHVGQLSEYSWWCEAGAMGGGLLNLYGAGLIDIAHILAGKLRMATVNCISRTFNPRLNPRMASFRRIYAEDYMHITSELEVDSFSNNFTEERSPILVICMASPVQLSTSKPVTGVESMQLADSSSLFELRIEITGSHGRFLVTENGRQITWTPATILYSLSSHASVSSKAALVVDRRSAFARRASASHKNRLHSNNLSFNEELCKDISPPEELSRLHTPIKSKIYSGDDLLTNNWQLNMNSQSRSSELSSNILISEASSKSFIRLARLENDTEAAYIDPEASP